MRLIDADALPDALFQKHVHDGDDTEMLLYYEDAVDVINATPTIDAIPTDWLRAKMKEYESREFDEPGMYFRFVLWAWQKHCDEDQVEVKPKRLKDQVCGNDYCELR